MVIPPAILHAPLGRFVRTRIVLVVPRQHHGVSHETLAVPQPIRLGQSRRRRPERRFVIPQFRRHDAAVLHVALRPDVAPEPHGIVPIDRLLRVPHKILDGEVEVEHVPAPVDVPQHFHRQRAPVRIPRVVHDAHQIRDVRRHVLLVELSRGLIRVGEELLLLVVRLPVERRGGFSQVYGDDAIHRRHHLLLPRADVLDRLSVDGQHPAQFPRVVPQLEEEESVHPSCELRRLDVGIHALGNDAVLLDDVDDHVPLSAVADGIGQQVRDEAILHLLVGRRDDVFQEVIALLELVVEEEVGLR
mmetsp:Transcript_17594/g.36791  ORF Transcript_17594/g.36791 Transcript_17594/m.36791 type:complete len:302 (-) Transcript_17594:392-1297(-)